MWIVVLVFVVVALVGYAFYLRPILLKTPGFAELYVREGTLWAALSAKFGGIKQQFVGALMVLASTVIFVYDAAAPYLGAVDTTPLLAWVPAKVWPLLSIGSVLLLQYFRYLSDKQHAAEVAETEAAANATVVAVKIDADAKVSEVKAAANAAIAEVTAKGAQ
jgi:Tfp pilus assembly protein PilO